MSLGVYLKWLKSVPIDTFLLIETYFSVYLRPERSPAARRCACWYYDGVLRHRYMFCAKLTNRVIGNIIHDAIDHVHGGNTGWDILFPALRRSTRVQSLSWLSPKTILRPQSLPICIYLNSIIFRFYYQPRGARRPPWPPPCTTNSSYQPRGARRPPWLPPLDLKTLKLNP